MNTTPLQGDTAAGHSWPSIGGEYYTPTLRERARERESEKTTNAVEKHASFVFITHKRDLYTRPMRVLSRHDGHQALAHGKSAEQEGTFTGVCVLLLYLVVKASKSPLFFPRTCEYVTVS